jgi:hypothetical protein
MRRAGQLGAAILSVTSLLACLIFFCSSGAFSHRTAKHECCEKHGSDQASLDGCTSPVFALKASPEIPAPQIAFQPASALPGPKNGGDSVPSPKASSQQGDRLIKNRVLRL